MAGNISQLGFGGRRQTKSITNYFSSGGVSSAAAASGARVILSGALTANTLKTILSVSGAGDVPFLSAYVNDVTSRTVRLRVTVDGTVVFDATSNAITTNLNGVVAAGAYTAASPNPAAAGSPIIFNQSLTVEVASSLTETDKLSVAYVLHGV